MNNQHAKNITSEQESVLNKVKKLLSLANNNSCIEEAENSMLKAQELLAKYSLTMQDLVEEKEDNVSKILIDESQRVVWWKGTLAMIIADNFRCVAYKSRSGIHLIGLEEDIAIATEVYNYAVRIIDVQSKKFAKNHSYLAGTATQIKNDFITGFLNGLRDKFKEQVKSQNYGLVLIKSNAVIKAVEEMKFRKAQRSKVSMGGDISARQAGYQQGKNFGNPSTKQIK